MKNWYLIVLLSVGGLSNTPLSALPTDSEIRDALDVISLQIERQTSISDQRLAQNAWRAWHSFIAKPWNRIHDLKRRINPGLSRKELESLITFKQEIDQQLSPEEANHYAIANGLIKLLESKRNARNAVLPAQIQILIDAAKSYQAWLTKKRSEITSEIKRQTKAPRIPSRGRASEPKAQVPHHLARSKSRIADRIHHETHSRHFIDDEDEYDRTVLASLHSTSGGAGAGAGRKSRSPRGRTLHIPFSAPGSFGDSAVTYPYDHVARASRHSRSGGAGAPAVSRSPSPHTERPPAHAARSRSRSPHHSPHRTPTPPTHRAHTHSRSPHAAPRPSRSPSPRRASSIDGTARVIALNPSRQEGNNCAVCAILNAQRLFEADARSPLSSVVLPTSEETTESRKGFNQTIIKNDVVALRRRLGLNASEDEIEGDTSAINTDSMIKILKDLNLMGDDDMFKSSGSAELAIIENGAPAGNTQEDLSARYNARKRIVTIFYVGEQAAGAVGHWVCTVYQKEPDGSQTIYRADSEYNSGNRSADITVAETVFGSQLTITE